MTLIVMLEDDLVRIERFRSIVANRRPGGQLKIWRTAYDFIVSYASLVWAPDLIALDHDLFTDGPNDPDPGDGRDVAAFLASRTPACPVLIHSSNASAADSMLFTLRDTGWSVDRISPLGDDWIEAYWYPYAMRMVDSAS